MRHSDADGRSFRMDRRQGRSLPWCGGNEKPPPQRRRPAPHGATLPDLRRMARHCPTYAAWRDIAHCHFRRFAVRVA